MKKEPANGREYESGGGVGGEVERERETERKESGKNSFDLKTVKSKGWKVKIS